MVIPVLVLCVCARLFGQSDSSPLLRIERIKPGEAVCALVNDNGSYRLEKLFRAKNELYTGTVDETRISQLRGLLADQRLHKLSQTDIHSPLVSDSFETLQLAISREAGWQALTFASAESSKPFKDFVDPLLRWFQDLQKQHPSAIRVEGAPTRCMPAPLRRVVIAKPDQASLVPPPASAYLFRISSSHFYGAHVDSACTIVLGDGRFHRERANQEFMADRRNRVAEGQLEPEALKELHDLLDSSGLKNSPSSDVGPVGQVMREGTLTRLAIPRDRQIQNLFFLTSFNTIGNPHEIGGKSNMTYHIADQKLLEPIMRWMKRYTEKQAHAVELEAVGNDCSPTQTAVSAEKPAD